MAAQAKKKERKLWKSEAKLTQTTQRFFYSAVGGPSRNHHHRSNVGPMAQTLLKEEEKALILISERRAGRPPSTTTRLKGEPSGSATSEYKRQLLHMRVANNSACSINSGFRQKSLGNVEPLTFELFVLRFAPMMSLIQLTLEGSPLM